MTLNRESLSTYKCTIKYIDDSDFANFEFQKQDLGSKLILEACSRLNLVETDYFGLRYVDKTGQRHWINALKPLSKQLSKCEAPYILCFRVKYYPPDLTIIQEEITRYQLYLQVKRDLQHGRLLCSRHEAALLGAYVLQATLGEFDEDLHEAGYSKVLKLAAAYKDEQFTQAAEEYHRVKMTGLSTSESERSFLVFASSLPTYGVDPYPCKSDQGSALHYSFTWKGLGIFEKNRLSKMYPWANVVRLTYANHWLKVVAKEHGFVKEYKTSFDMGNEANARHVWQCSVEQMVFFTQKAEAPAKKIRSSRSILRRGTSLKFCGKTVDELRSTSLGRTSSLRERDKFREYSLERRDTGRATLPRSRHTPAPLSIDTTDSGYGNSGDNSRNSLTSSIQSDFERTRSLNGNDYHQKSASVTHLNESSDSGLTGAGYTVRSSRENKKNKEDWKRATEISTMHTSQLSKSISEDHLPGVGATGNMQTFNSRDSTLDITKSFQLQYSRNTTTSASKSRALTDNESSSDDLPSAMELKESLSKLPDSTLLMSVPNGSLNASSLLNVPPTPKGTPPVKPKPSPETDKKARPGGIYETLLASNASKYKPRADPKASPKKPEVEEEQITVVKQKEVHASQGSVSAKAPSTNALTKNGPIKSDNPTKSTVNPKPDKPEQLDKQGDPKDAKRKTLKEKTLQYSVFAFGLLCGIASISFLLTHIEMPGQEGASTSDENGLEPKPGLIQSTGNTLSAIVENLYNVVQSIASYLALLFKI